MLKHVFTLLLLHKFDFFLKRMSLCQSQPHPLASEVRAVNLGTLSQSADIEGLFKLEGVETLNLSSTSGK